MAEGHEERMAELTQDLFAVYVDLQLTCKLLPIPLLLPRFDAPTQIVDLLDAAHQAAVAIPDQPLHGRLTSVLADTLNMWVGAAILVETADANEGDTFYAAAASLIEHLAHGAQLVLTLVQFLPEERD
jgi:hypothetical protein